MVSRETAFSLGIFTFVLALQGKCGYSSCGCRKILRSQNQTQTT